MDKIPFNKPHLTGNETAYIKEAVSSGKISGNGAFTKKCQAFFRERYGFKKALLTTSCTDALEMCALLADIQPGDEVIIPSYTFVSTALAFVRQGAVIKFADSRSDHPGINEESIESLISDKTKAIVPVHYAGIACDMDLIMNLANQHDLLVIEDAAQAIESNYKGHPLGSIGNLAAFSFHETKNINAGEGGLLAINDERFIDRSEIIWEKGTNRAAFFRGEIDKYGWVDTGSSFLPSELTAAFLWAQIENLEKIQQRRKEIWNLYYDRLSLAADDFGIQIPVIPEYATNNGHMFYLVCKSEEQRTGLIDYLNKSNILAVFHYQSLHKSHFYKDRYEGPELPYADKYTDRLVRLPFYYRLSDEEILKITSHVNEYFSQSP
ncbi:dTDP-4-amino-4,6-dideoxygalactose transaminase [Rhodohalobacter sulfatireducens]|uniref:dTDP-4-amino-4,6-dideoxygalactose transaminase n=1 Tax=Rhodohalobacter sulfatireducens TaxID=2911366 RepID=A0ABS9K895_9BACT|nr:dTDP-4-amino-4,6-dideoxygalactose transaminase [Rhodohalobacter sulfatireducens]MCG2587066.1 dTDP-4-amino-4,6-dideoxygalactose transaminase [Rhodohalobacter sulfatireducens]